MSATMVLGYGRLQAPSLAFDSARITGKSEVMPGTDSQRRWPEVGFGEVWSVLALRLPQLLSLAVDFRE